MGIVTALAVAGATLVAAQPAAAVGSDSWVSVPEAGYLRFTVPTSAVTAAVGATPAHFAVEGNWGPARSMGQLGLSSSGGNWTGLIGPMEPGLYTYQYKATIGGSEQLVTFRNPASPQEVTSNAALNTLFVPGADAQWITDVVSGGELATLAYDSTVTGAERSALVWTPPGYDANRAEPYPVLTLLPDSGQSYREWAELGRIGQISTTWPSKSSWSRWSSSWLTASQPTSVPNCSTAFSPQLATHTTCRRMPQTTPSPASVAALHRR